MDLILHLSDTHFGTEQPAVVEALVALAQAQRPQLAIWSGDITQRARRAQFRAAGALAARLGVPHMLAIPGNHDIPLFDLATRLLAPYRHYAAFGGGALAPQLETDTLLVLGVNCTRWWRHKHGVVSREQVLALETRLRAARPAQLRLVVVHQPLYVPAGGDRNNLLRGHAFAAQRWAAAGADLVLGGHIHLPFVQRLDYGMRPLWIVQAGTAVSRRVRAGWPNSVNLIRHQPAARSESGSRGRCTIERWDYDAGARAFARAAQVATALA